MLHGFLFRFFRMTKNMRFSIILAKLAYLVYFLKYLMRRIRCRKKIVRISKEDALAIIKKDYQPPTQRPEYNNTQADDSIDLSIIVPVYNYVDLIDNNISSILNQKTDYKFELIIVDDGSTDGAQDVVRKYANEPNVKAIFQKNKGIAGARNTGLENACGKYIMFVDCDDTVEDNIVDVLMKRAYKDDCDIVMCAHNLVKERNGEIYETVPNVYPDCDMLGYAKDAKILNYAGLPWCKVYKRELWQNIRYFPGFWYEDNIIHSLVFPQCEKFAYEPVICYQYRWYEKNFSHTQSASSRNSKCMDAYWIMLPILERYDELGYEKGDLFETMLLKHLSLYYYNTVSGLNNETVEALFSLACDLYEEYGVKENCKLPYMLKVTKRALLTRDINLWKLASQYQK